MQKLLTVALLSSFDGRRHKKIRGVLTEPPRTENLLISTMKVSQTLNTSQAPDLWPWGLERDLVALTGAKSWNWRRRTYVTLVEGIHWKRRNRSRVYYNLRLCQLWLLETEAEHRHSVERYFESLA